MDGNGVSIERLFNLRLGVHKMGLLELLYETKYRALGLCAQPSRRLGVISLPNPQQFGCEISLLIM